MKTAAFAARGPRSTASTIVTREVRGQHTLIIDGCAPSKKVPNQHMLSSRTFEAAGYHWRIRYHPGAGNSTWWLFSRPCISLYLELDGAHERVDHPVEVKFILLDRDGNPAPRHTRVAGVFVFDGEARRHGVDDFIRWKDLEQSGCLTGDSFTVRCDIAVIKDWAEDVDAAAVPPPDLHEHLYDLLWTKQGTDATIAVAGETFHVHKWLLAARSTVFEAELRAAATKEDDAPAEVQARLEIDGVEPRVFRAVLRFLYTDSLPRMEEGDAVAMTQGLLAVAHRYKLERLKPMCEEILHERIGVDTVAGTLAVAERHGCQALKSACVEFMTYPGNMKAVIETEGFAKIKADYPSLLMELVMKQLVA